MEPQLILLLLGLLISTVIYSLFTPTKKKRLPPGPPAFPIIGNLYCLRLTNSLSDIETLLRNLALRLGPIVTLHVGSHPNIVIADRVVAHKALVEHGATFASRPYPPLDCCFLNSRFLNISSSPYGPTWRQLRRNLTSEFLHPSKMRVFSNGRRWVLGLLLKRLQSKSQEFSDRVVDVKESFQFAMFAILLLMCFGERMDEQTIREIEDVQRNILLFSTKHLGVFNLVPKLLLKIFLRKRFSTFLKLKHRQSELLLPLIRARRNRPTVESEVGEQKQFTYSYVDSLLDISLAEEGGRRLSDEEVLVLCSELLTAGTDTTATALQWTMAQIVDQRSVQQKLVEEIENAVKRNGGELKEEDLQKMPYLKAVVMEGLRRHPPSHFVLPHAVTKDVELEGWLIPRNSSVNVMVADFGWDERVWKEPMEFKPERFMKGGDGEGVDITGNRELKMMPFGVGRRICPGIALAMLHIQYFVANLVKEFEWETVDGEKVDFTEKSEFTVVMKNPPRLRITPRSNA
ncbi:hypothetical protein HPP92_008713 [Vanilla planifolia]|uniref:Cytochrome P450 n=1 Tax=Vanilla planifolia TaxID=51239 RepID=A0A835RHV8_VANPL|nr:hypothetical protein HPP92_008713 [Vanilla planifolia]